MGWAALLSTLALSQAWGKDLRVTIPRHSEMTLVQRLNREGVDAVRKQQYEKAEALFLKAYLYDPADPFTLNNLGYISELQGQLDRALKFYQLASQQGSQAEIDRSNAKQLEGKPMDYALNSLKNVPMRVNHMNVESVQLLAENRNDEANVLLERALALDPQNSFTLNNLGVAKESLGDYAAALRYYEAAAAARSSEPVVVTLNRSWRGKPVSEMAAESAHRLGSRLKDADSPSAQAALLTTQGVSAANRNDWQQARRDFLRAYSLDPASAFSLNNLGYVSERDGDIETAQYLYSKAQKADDADARVGLASRPDVEGQHLVAVAGDSQQKVEGELNQYHAARRSETGDVELKRRDNGPAASPQTPSAPPATLPQQRPPATAQPPAPQTTVPQHPPQFN